MDKYKNLKMAVDVSLLYLTITTTLNVINGLIMSIFYHYPYAISVYSVRTPWFIVSVLLIIALAISSSVLKPYKCCKHMKNLIASLLLIFNGIIALASDSFMLERIFYYFTGPTAQKFDAQTVLLNGIALLLIIIQIIIGFCLCIYSIRKKDTSDTKYDFNNNTENENINYF